MTAFPAIVEALGWTLVHFIWQGAVIAGLYKAAETMVTGKGPQARYVAGLCALLAMVMASGVTFAISLGGALHSAPASAVAAIGDATILAPKSLAVQALPWVDAAWLVGVAVLSARLLADLWRIQRLSRLALPAPAAVLRIFERALARLGARSGAARRTCLRLHAFITEPFVVGIFRSVVYLPLSAVTALAPEQLEAVLAHELEHVRRADYAWNLLQSVVETLFFYHPAVWWIGAKLRQYRELCCDDAALATCRDPLVYATALLSLAEQKRGAPSLAMAMSGLAGCDLAGSPSLLARIGRVLGETPSETRSKGRRNMAAIVALAMLATAYVAALALDRAESSVVHKVERLTARMSAIAHVPSTPPARTYRTVIRSSAPVARPSPAAFAAPVVPPAAAQGPRVVGAEVDGNQITYEVTGPPHGDLLTRLLPVPREARAGQTSPSGTVATYKITFVAPKVVVSEAYPRGTTALDSDQNYRVVVTKVPNGAISDMSGAAVMRLVAKGGDKLPAAPSKGPGAGLQYRCATASCRYILNNDPDGPL